MGAFIHNTKLDHLLRPEDYSSQEFWKEEITHLFHKSWQYAGLADHVAKPGSHLARDVAGVPVVVRNFGGELRAFRNSCPHRHSMIVGEGRGCSRTFKCMYHGWEFGDKGQVTHIPDGISFHGIKAADHSLQSLRLCRVGSLLFVNLSPGEETLRQSVGALGPELDQYFGNHQPVWHWVSEHEANWKIIEENAVESYHVPMAHPETFAHYKAPELHDHALEPGYTRYADLEPWKHGVVDCGFKALARHLVPKPNYERFKHTHIFPNNLLYYNEIFSTWASLQPVSPGRTRYEIVGFIPRNLRGGLPARLALRFIVQPLIKQFARILSEDMKIWPTIHRGLKHSPHTGVLSCREERVHAFQEHVLAKLPERFRLARQHSAT